MKRILVVLLLIAPALFAQTSTAPATDVQALKDAVAAQQLQIQKLIQKIDQLEQNGQQAQAAAAAAAAEANAKASAAQSDVAGLKTEVNSATLEAQNAEKKVGELEKPNYIHYRNVRITPGGYAQFATIYDSHNANSDTDAQYGTYPLSGSANSKLNEFRQSGRASRLSLKVEGEANDLKFLGYFETDFLGTTANSTETQTNSYAPRLRLAFGSVKKGSWRITGGQGWTLLQTTKSGIDPLTEWLPAVIDNSYTPGFSYARLGELRVTKALGNKAWVAFAVDNPQTVSNIGCVQTTNSSGAALATPVPCTISTIIQGLQNSTITGSPTNTSFGSTNLPSSNIAPDLIAKVAIEPGWGHFEVKAVGRFFRDRAYSPYLNQIVTSSSPVVSTKYPGANNVTVGGGLGFGAILPVIAKKLDIEVQALGGKGIGRYGTASGPDVTLDSNGSLDPVKSLQAIVGIEAHPNPKLDLYVYGGDEYYGKASYKFKQPVGTATAGDTYIIGYGAQQFLDGGCNTQYPAASGFTSCQSSGQTRNLWAVQPGFWYRLYKGSAGTVQFGASYAYIYRRTWDGEGAASGTLAHPLAIENRVLTAFRYYLP